MWVAGWFLVRVFQCWKGAGELISTQNSTHLQQTTCFDNESKIKVRLRISRRNEEYRRRQVQCVSRMCHPESPSGTAPCSSPERCQQTALSFLGLQRVACLPCSKSSPPQVSPPNKWIRGRLKRHSDQCGISRRPASSVVPTPLPAVSEKRDGWDEGIV